MSIITDLAGVAIEKIPDAYARAKGYQRKIGALEDKLTAWSRVYLPRHRVVLPDVPRTCTRCLEVPDELDQFCAHCGAKLRTPNVLARLKQTSRFCPMCGKEENQCEATCVRRTHPR